MQWQKGNKLCFAECKWLKSPISEHLLLKIPSQSLDPDDLMGMTTPCNHSFDPLVAAVRAKALLEATEEDGACAVKPEENFLEEIFRVLLNARRILSASYCIGYFIPDQERAEIQAHETLQVRGILFPGDCDGHLMTTFVNETSSLCVDILV